MWRELRNRRLLITGASSGIGQALAREAARRGARLALTSRSADKLQELAGELEAQGTEVLVHPADITSENDRDKLVAAVVERFGGLDVLINNAGVASFGHFADSTEEILRQVMEVNFFAPTEMIRKCIPILTEGEQPAVVNVASMCGRRGMPAWPEYSASKFALCGLTEAFRGELARFDIDIVLILPGLTRTNLSRNLLRNEGRMKIEHDKGMEPEFVGKAILDALQKNKKEVVLGWEARWILRVNRFFPGLVNRLMIRKVGQLYANS